MKKISLILTLCAILISARVAHAMGLSTSFGRIIVENIRIGQSYSMQDNGTPFMIENTGKERLKLKIDILIPEEAELIEGYLPLPDREWIVIGEDSFILPPQSKISTDIIITIPDDERYRGRKYQAYIWSHTEGAIAIGLKSKLLIEIAE